MTRAISIIVLIDLKDFCGLEIFIEYTKSTELIIYMIKCGKIKDKCLGPAHGSRERPLFDLREGAAHHRIE